VIGGSIFTARLQRLTAKAEDRPEAAKCDDADVVAQFDRISRRHKQAAPRKQTARRGQ
jgi:hypothetical protein